MKFLFPTGRASEKGDPDEPVLRRVLPATHEESYRIMERYKADLAQRAEDEAALLAMQTKELNNGRLGMIAAAGMIFQETFVTHAKLF